MKNFFANLIIILISHVWEVCKFEMITSFKTYLDLKSNTITSFKWIYETKSYSTLNASRHHTQVTGNFLSNLGLGISRRIFRAEEEWEKKVINSIMTTLADIPWAECGQCCPEKVLSRSRYLLSFMKVGWTSSSEQIVSLHYALKF